jgi:hypothetical protein
MPKFTWFESFTTTVKYSAEISEEEAQLFTEDPDRFFEEVDYRYSQELEWDKITDEDTYDFDLEEE